MAHLSSSSPFPDPAEPCMSSTLPYKSSPGYPDLCTAARAHEPAPSYSHLPNITPIVLADPDNARTAGPVAADAMDSLNHSPTWPYNIPIPGATLSNTAPIVAIHKAVDRELKHGRRQGHSQIVGTQESIGRRVLFASPLLAMPLHTLLEGLARLLRGDQRPDRLHLENLLIQDCLATPGFSDLSTPMLASFITVILDCAYGFASSHRAVHSASAERTIHHSAHFVDTDPDLVSDVWTSSDGQTIHVSSVTYPDGHRYIFPSPHSTVSLPRVEVSVLNDVGDDCIDEEYIDDVDSDDEVPPLVDL
ncbi:hypothetical protein K466DRAFT_607266 [Polyporus arcularius HHB13444]|uniref:Uncharacterized protein n=1 Tax=Polyporus arcularius HHB13444 TaxID=1314778 RepID=A0A5C3NPB5_9APHY|nr:hypothetical protein K466DRAFT_607266 [Polyporus arcularius HHB13444]